NVSGSSVLSVNSPKSIVISGNLSTGSGDLSLLANQQVTATSGSFTGLEVTGATVGSTSGAITLQGRGGDTGGVNWGVYIHNGATVGSGTSNSVSVLGTGGSATGGINYGVFIGDSGTMVTSAGGSVSVTGTGGGISLGSAQN